MALTDMAFSPATGLLDTTTYPTEPADETAARTQIQGRLNEIRDWLNDTLIVELMKASYLYAADTGSTDDYAITLAPVPAAYTVGMPVIFKANTANTGAATLNVNSLGAKTIKKKGASGTLADLTTGDIAAGNVVVAVYDGTYFVTDLGLSSHLAETVSENLLVTRDISLTGLQTITLATAKIPKEITIEAIISSTKKFSIGKYSHVGSQYATYMDATGVVSLTEAAVSIAESLGVNFTTGLIQDIASGSFKINWTKTGSGGVGTAYMAITAKYHD